MSLKKQQQTLPKKKCRRTKGGNCIGKKIQEEWSHGKRCDRHIKDAKIRKKGGGEGLLETTITYDVFPELTLDSNPGVKDTDEDE